MVTAEAALVLPIMALVALAMLWVVSVGIAEVRVIDAARDAARMMARGDSAAEAVQAARRTAGGAADVRIDRGDGLVEVQVTVRMSPPGWLLLPLPDVTLRSTSSVEDDDAPPA
jgi:hypothetical protein